MGFRTTNKTVADLAQSLGLKYDRPAETCINVRKQNNSIAFTCQTTAELYAWLQGYKWGIEGNTP